MVIHELLGMDAYLRKIDVFRICVSHVTLAACHRFSYSGMHAGMLKASCLFLI
jgi:hypothetical protein